MKILHKNRAAIRNVSLSQFICPTLYIHGAGRVTPNKVCQAKIPLDPIKGFPFPYRWGQLGLCVIGDSCRNSPVLPGCGLRCILLFLEKLPRSLRSPSQHDWPKSAHCPPPLRSPPPRPRRPALRAGWHPGVAPVGWPERGHLTDTAPTGRPPIRGVLRCQARGSVTFAVNIPAPAVTASASRQTPREVRPARRRRDRLQRRRRACLATGLGQHSWSAVASRPPPAVKAEDRPTRPPPPGRGGGEGRQLGSQWTFTLWQSARPWGRCLSAAHRTDLCARPGMYVGSTHIHSTYTYIIHLSCVPGLVNYKTLSVTRLTGVPHT